MNTQSSNGISFKGAALISALCLLLMIGAAIFADSLRQGLIVDGDINATTNNLITQSLKLRLSILFYIIVIILDILVAWSLYFYFYPINKSISLLAGWFRLIYAILFFVALLNLIDIVQLSDKNSKQAQVMFSLQLFTTQWNLSFVFFGIHLGLIGWLVIWTKQIHNIFGILLIAAGFGYAIDGLGKALIPGYSLSLIMFTFIGEVLLMLWLFIKGTKNQPSIKTNE